MIARLTRLLLANAAFSAVLLVPSLHAVPITGTLQITGDASVSATALNFLCTVTTSGAQPCPAGYGNFTATPLSNGSFAPYANDVGFIRSINQTTTPINQSFLFSNFIVFSPTGTVVPPDIALDLTFIFPGNSGQAGCASANQTSGSCTPVIPALISPSNPAGLSPINFANTSTGSTASFAVSGTARRISTGEVSPFNGNFTAQFTSTPGTTNGSFQTILGQIAAGQSISASYSATLVAATAVPEPGTTMLMLGGLLFLAGSTSRLRRRASK